MQSEPSTNTRAARLAWSLCGLALLLTVGGLLLFFLNRGTVTPASWGIEAGVRGSLLDLINGLIYGFFYTVAISAMGALIVARHPRHPLGWLLCSVGLAFGLIQFVQEATIYTNFTLPDTPGGLYIAWVNNWVWVLVVTLALSTVALFPDGRLPSRRWRWLLGLIALFSILMIGYGFIASPMDSAFYLDNPFVPRPLPDYVLEIVWGLFVIVLVLSTIGGAAAGIVRFRRAGRDERQQFKWLVGALLLSVLAVVVGLTTSAMFGSRLGELLVNWSFT
ncbi:MAG: hypothetical protein ACRDIB_00670, partial [Ardenticatenaceae bacterium]